MFHVINIQGSFLFVLLFQNCLLNIYRRLTAITGIFINLENFFLWHKRWNDLSVGNRRIR